MVNIKSLPINSALVFFGAFLNFLVFLIAYKTLAFPHLNEEQRVDNAPFIFTCIFPGFFITSALLLILYKIVLARFNLNR